MEPILRVLRKVIPKPLFEFFRPAYHFVWAFIGNLIYGFPGRKIKIIAVTGTNGKSTTSILITRVLEAAGCRVGLSSTVMFKIAEKEWVNETNKTVLGRFAIPKLLKQMVNAKCEWAVVEVTAHALVQSRVWGLNPDIAVFTNLAPEHLDYFKDMEEYRNAKGRLFKMLQKSKQKGVPKTAIMNADDHEFEYFAGFNTEKKINFGLSEHDLPGTYYRAQDINLSLEGSRFTIVDETGHSQPIQLKLLGRFNVYNALAAYSACVAAGIDEEKITNILGTVAGISGRMEFIKAPNGAWVVVDYAHTPDAFEALFGTLKEIAPDTRIVAVFGATGDRDRIKRPEMGRIASSYAKRIILTNEEPYTEDPERIIKEIEAGMPDGISYGVVIDRREAITKALAESKQGEIITVTGMGHQNYAVFGEKKIPWNDKEEVLKVINDKS